MFWEEGVPRKQCTQKRINHLQKTQIQTNQNNYFDILKKRGKEKGDIKILVN